MHDEQPKYIVAGDGSTSFGPSLKPRSPNDLSAVLRYDPDLTGFADRCDDLPYIDTKQLRKGDFILMLTEKGDKLGYIVDENTDCPKGKLLLPESTVQLMGIPGVISDVVLEGSQAVDQVSHNTARLNQFMKARFLAPLKNLKVPLIYKEEENVRLLMQTAPIVAAMCSRLHQLPEPIKAKISSVIESLGQMGIDTDIPVSSVVLNDWPGKSTKNITEAQLLEILRLFPRDSLWGLRGNLWINPQSGAISRFGLPIEGESTVWDRIGREIKNYSGIMNGEVKIDDEQNKPLFISRTEYHIAALTYWAQKLGLKPPQNIIGELAAVGLGFSI